MKYFILLILLTGCDFVHNLQNKKVFDQHAKDRDYCYFQKGVIVSGWYLKKYGTSPSSRFVTSFRPLLETYVIPTQEQVDSVYKLTDGINLSEK